MFRVRTQLGLTDAYDREMREMMKRRRFMQTENQAESKIGIAVLDSGVALHPDIKDSVMAFRDFITEKSSFAHDGKIAFKKSRALSGSDFLETQPYDDYGHGTHVCGILCGNGMLSDGKYRGIFPEGRLIVGKVLDSWGDGCAEDMIEGMRWVLQQKDSYGIRLLNISVGISGLKDREKLHGLQDMLLRITKAGILVICAAGNKGPSAGTLSALGEMPEIISVGCHDGNYFRMDPRRCDHYCSRGKERAIPRKPDVVAPGTCIISCSRKYLNGSRFGNSYEERSGTSMSAPIVTGCLGRVLQMNPSLSPTQLRRILTRSAKDLGEPWNKQGWGMVQPKKMEAELF